MLELVVLGVVPGTRFQITFLQALLGLLAFVFITMRFRAAKQSAQLRQQELQEISL